MPWMLPIMLSLLGCKGEGNSTLLDSSKNEQSNTETRSFRSSFSSPPNQKSKWKIKEQPPALFFRVPIFHFFKKKRGSGLSEIIFALFHYFMTIFYRRATLIYLPTHNSERQKDSCRNPLISQDPHGRLLEDFFLLFSLEDRT